MKFGIRKPSIKKRIAARTSVKRIIRQRIGLKAPRGWGWLTNPRRAAYNRVYNRTTVGCQTILLVATLLLIGAGFAFARGGHGKSYSGKSVYVHGYTKRNGIYVHGYYRSRPSTGNHVHGLGSNHAGGHGSVGLVPIADQRGLGPAGIPVDRSSGPNSGSKDSQLHPKPSSRIYAGKGRHTYPAIIKHHRSLKAKGVARDSRGRIKRSSSARHAFQKVNPCPSTGNTSGACPGYVIDHIIPLKRGGSDIPSNMQWQTIEAAKAKDLWE